MATSFVGIFTLSPNRNVGSLKIFLINLVCDSFATMSSDVLCLCILKDFVMLNCEVLSFDLFLELLSFGVTPCWFIMTFLKLFWIIGRFTSKLTSFLIQAVLKLVAQVEITSLLVNLQSLFWFEIRVLGIEIFGVVGSGSMMNLMLNSSFLRTVSKADSHDSISVFRITSSRILVILCWAVDLFLLGNLRDEGLLFGTRLLIWSLLTFCSFEANLISCSLHDFVDSKIDVNMVFVNFKFFSMICLFGRFIIVDIRTTFCGGQMILWTLVIGKNHFLISIENDGIGLRSNTLFPQLVWLLSLSNVNIMWPTFFLTREYSLVRIDFPVVLIIRRLLLMIIFYFGSLLIGSSNLSLSWFLAGLRSLTKFLTCFVISLFPFSRFPMTVEDIRGAIQSRLSWRLEATISCLGLLFNESCWDTELILEWLDVGVLEILEENGLLSIIKFLIRNLVYI